MSKHGKLFKTCRDIVAGCGMFSIIIGMYYMWEPLAWICGGVAAVASAVASYWMEPENDKRKG
jgi:hypothetical protein